MTSHRALRHRQFHIPAKKPFQLQVLAALNLTTASWDCAWLIPLGFRDRLNAGSRRRISSPRDRAVPRRRPRCTTSTMPDLTQKWSATSKSASGAPRPTSTAGSKVTVASQANFALQNRRVACVEHRARAKTSSRPTFTSPLAKTRNPRQKGWKRHLKNRPPHPASHTSPVNPGCTCASQI